MLIIEARNAFKKGRVVTSMIKHAYEINPHRLRVDKINNKLVGKKHSRYSCTKTQEYAVSKYKAAIAMIKNTEELLSELQQERPENAKFEEISSRAEDMLRCWEDENHSDYQIN